MEPLSFFGRIVQKSILFFQIQLFRKRRNRKELQRMAAVMLQVIPSFYTSYPSYPKNSLFNSANTYVKYIVSKEYCIAGRDD